MTLANLDVLSGSNGSPAADRCGMSVGWGVCLCVFGVANCMLVGADDVFVNGEVNRSDLRVLLSP